MKRLSRSPANDVRSPENLSVDGHVHLCASLRRTGNPARAPDGLRPPALFSQLRDGAVEAIRWQRNCKEGAPAKTAKQKQIGEQQSEAFPTRQRRTHAVVSVAWPRVNRMQRCQLPDGFQLLSRAGWTCGLDKNCTDQPDNSSGSKKLEAENDKNSDLTQRGLGQIRPPALIEADELLIACVSYRAAIPSITQYLENRQ